MITDILTRNNVKISGNGSKPILFAHGFGCDQSMWRMVAPAFENEYKVILFDYVGSGKSDYTSYDADRYLSLHGYAQDVLEICEALELKNVVFVGHSVSSMIGLLASIQKPELFDRMILIGPSPCYLNDPPSYMGGFEKTDLEALFELMEKNYFGWANYLAPIVMQNPERPELAQELGESFCASDPAIARSFAKATILADNRADLDKVTVPSLILQCAEDVIAPPAVGDYVNRKLADSVLVRMKATGHCPHMSHPEETTRLIQAYLASANERSVRIKTGDIFNG